MDVRYYIDPKSGLPHLHHHGVEDEEIRQVMIRPGDDRPGADGLRIAIGFTAGGRPLKVVYVPDEAGEVIFVVTAYEWQGKALQA